MDKPIVHCNAADIYHLIDAWVDQLVLDGRIKEIEVARGDIANLNKAIIAYLRERNMHLEIQD